MKKIQMMIWVFALTFTSYSYAQNAFISEVDLSGDFFRMGTALSMGGAYRALADSPQAIIFNPAGMKQNQGRLMAAGDYAYFQGYEGHQYGVSVVDTATSQAVAYGLSYHKSNPSIGGVGAKNNQAMLSIAHQTGAFYTGGSLKGYWIKSDSANYEGPTGIDLDVGLMFKASEMFSIAFVGYNLVRGRKIEEYPLQLALGGAITVIPQATFTIDAVKNFNTDANNDINIHIGGSIDLNEQFSIRGGYAMDRVSNNDYYGAGLSVKAKQAVINFAFGQTIDPRSEIYSVNLEYRM